MLDPNDGAPTGAPIPDAPAADAPPPEASSCVVVREPLAPKDHGEAVAIFRSQVIGPLLTRHLEGHGELVAILREVCAEPHRPPWSNVSYRYAASTVERWYYAYRKGGLVALRPRPRHARALTPALRQLVLDIRQEHPQASAALILRTLVLDGRIPARTLTESTVRRLLEQEGLDRQSLRQGQRRPRPSPLGGRGPRRPLALRRLPRTGAQDRGAVSATAHPRPARRQEPLRPCHPGLLDRA